MDATTQKTLTSLFPETSPEAEDVVLEVDPQAIEVSDFVNPTDEFIESIRRFGILHPPLVCMKSKNDKKLIVLSGRRRVMAAKHLGLKTITVVCRNGVYYADAMAHILTLEAQQKTYPNPVAEFRAVRSLVGEGYTQDEICNTLGISRERINYLLGFGNIPEDVLDGVQAGKVRVTTLESMSRLSAPFLQKAVEKYREQGSLTGPDIKKVKAARRNNEHQRVMANMPALPSPIPSNPGKGLDEKTMDLLRSIESLSLEMTGHTGDALEAFDQWKSERQALAEFQSLNAALETQNDRLMDIRKAAVNMLEQILKEDVKFGSRTNKAIAAFEESLKRFEKLAERHHDRTLRAATSP